MNTPILKLENINKKISDFFKLDNINFDLYKGEVHAILGENGSGKSSLMNIISGSILKDSGNIYSDGTLVDICSSLDAKNLGIIMNHQDPTLFENFSIAENIFFDSNPLSKKSLFKTINWIKMYDDCDKLFKKLKIDLNCRTLVKTIGPAQKQLVVIAKAYVSNARIIIMDEPTSYFTDNETSILFDVIKELQKSGTSIIYISHRLEEIKHICDRVTVLRDGRIIGTEYVSSLDTFKLINMMTGLDIKERYPKLNVKIGKEILKIKNISCGTTLKDISFSLRKREILGIIGLVGSGRSKVAKSIFGDVKTDTGEIVLEGKRLDIKSPLDAIKNGFGYVSEDRQIEGLFMYLNISENISVSSLQNLSNNNVIDLDREKELVNNLIERLSINIGTIYNNAENLSGGNQQKVVLAKWIMSKSKIFILDEPTRGIDIASKVDVYNLMNELVRKGASIILISSDINEVLGLCDRTLVLYNGEIAATLSRSEATQENIMYYATGGKNDEYST